MRKFIIAVSTLVFACTGSGPSNEKSTKVEDLLSKMTLEEKVGQLNFLIGDGFNTGPTLMTRESNNFDVLVKEGKITGLFNVYGAKYTARLQKIAVEQSRLKIPLLFGADVIHGFKTVAPIPLAEAASWDLAEIERSAQVAAEESSAVGINWTFAPMVDVCRDPRWGRVLEGAGEDSFLASRIAEARVRGFQGKSLADARTIAACVKHFAAYGAPLAGRDYTEVDMSERQLREVYLPPYEAAIKQGAATVMNAFNDFNGIPATANKFLLQQVLRKEWKFNGVVVSDWQSIGELIPHGIAADSVQAAQLAMDASVDVDMMANVYATQLIRLIQAGSIKQSQLDDAVRRVLQLKFDLGLFDDPYRYSNEEREKKEMRTDAQVNSALSMAKKSIVLLKNENELLPFSKDESTLAVIGPLANAPAEMNGSWSFFGEPQHAVSILDGIRKKVSPKTFVLFAEGCNLYDDATDKFAQAKAIAQRASKLIVVLGESAVMNGEGASRSSIGLPGVQLDLLKALAETKKPLVVVLVSGRPLTLEWIDQHIPAILETWTLGSEAGNAVAEVLFGDYNPSGKLPITFPRNEGQIPIYYSHKHGGRPYEGDYQDPLNVRIYKSKYRDVRNEPLYPFGYGLSYTKFEYSNLIIDKEKMSTDESVEVSVTVKNVGKVAGEEVVQWYIRDWVGSVTRPVKELKGFEKILLQPGESKTVKLNITSEVLSFYRADMSWGVEPGKFSVMVGTKSANVLAKDFVLN